ncbi:hypothetical protein HCB27_02140 [Listeria booriae]|uniref:Bacteriophage abortive infection AbiH n=1 Tax=Listeria booriae TaxID=1552123 RepID=A0A7X1D7A9_9LIST|nr:AbiH family protein [Listeria booriae]MBC2175402.1 hypothetical protein [Listeria booriae]
MSQLIILGNGFDIQSGLESRFSDFYKDRMENILSLKCIDSEFDLDKSSHDKLQINYKGNPEIVLPEIEPCKWEAELNELTFWDLVMIYEDNKGICINWCNIEAHIQKVTEFVLNMSSNINTLKDLLEASEKISAPVYSNERAGSLKIILGRLTTNEAALSMRWINKYTIFLCIINALNDNKYENIGLDEMLFMELQKYEHSFQQYLTKEIRIKRESYDEKRFSLLERIHTRETYGGMILNFNYTSDSFPLYSKGIDLDVVNVHGTLDNEIIFGIDHKNVDAESKMYPFTKTFRKMVIDDDKPLSIVNKDIKYLIFYGHSLGSADYSYFQSIFDYLNVYENEIYLQFYFTNYLGGAEGEMLLKRELASLVQKLLHGYGKTMDNKSKGKNLIHKLLIENRVQIITLDSIDLRGVEQSIKINEIKVGEQIID